MEVRRATPDDYRALFEDHALGQIVFNDLSKRFAKAPKLDGTQEGLLLTTIYAAQRQMLDFILQMAAQDTVLNAEMIARQATPVADYRPNNTTENEQ